MLRSLLIAHRNNGAAAVVGEPREARVVQVEVVQHPAAPRGTTRERGQQATPLACKCALARLL